MINFIKSLFTGPAYKSGEFILTKKDSGGVAVRIEHVNKHTLLCSLGSVNSKDGKLIWKVKEGADNITIHQNNVEKKLSIEDVEDFISKNIVKPKRASRKTKV